LDLPNTARNTEAVGVASWDGGPGVGAGGGGGGGAGAGAEVGGKEPGESKERDIEAVSIWAAGGKGGPLSQLFRDMLASFLNCQANLSKVIGFCLTAYVWD
jgi:hypothetical protein